jgi:nicotinamidase-related amidase
VSAMSTALLLIDLQRDFLEPTGRMPIASAQVGPLIEACNALGDAAAVSGAPVGYIVNAFPESQWLLNFLRRGAARVGTSGAAIDPRVHRVAGAELPKEHTDAFTNPALEAWLRARGATTLVVTGVFAPACVRATVAGAIARDHRVVLVREAVGAASDVARDRALRAMQKRGATIVGVRDAIAMLGTRPTSPS